MQTRRLTRAVLSLGVIGLVAYGCGQESQLSPPKENSNGRGGSSQQSGGQGTGGEQPSSGGASASGGTDASGGRTTGGTSATGGQRTGGTSATGGQRTGGTSSTGGQATGGTSATGGQATGGTSSTGGQRTGGTSATGGQATGGTSTTGGQRTGGTTASGGATASGGQATGGDSATGGSTSSSCPTAEEEKFSFFLISYEAVQRESGNPDGFGGDLGGLSGADGICQRVAEYVSSCQSSKVWRAFLSTSTVDAIDRIGTGPWYDRNARLLANGLSDLVQDRPANADPIIKNDFPNEYGIPNHAPDGGTQVDNHEILTGSGTDGRKYTQSGGTGTFPGGATSCQDAAGWTIEAGTCWGWTTKEEKGCPRVGHSWPRQGSGTNWMSCWNEGGCAPGGNLTDAVAGGGLDGTRRVGSAGGYGGWYCFAQIPTP